MKKLGLGFGALVGGLITAALMGLMYLADGLLSLPFAPFDIFNWVAREMPGDIITFGIDLMIDTLRFLGISVVDAAKTAEQLMALSIYLVGGIFAGLVYFGVMRARKIQSSQNTGLAMGLLYGLPQVFISLAITQSSVSAVVIILYLLVLFLAWGLVLNRAYDRLTGIRESADEAVNALILDEAMAAGLEEPAVATGMPVESEAEPVASMARAATIRSKEQEIRSVEKINRRQFLVRLGASTATITVIGGGLGAVLASAERRDQAEVVSNVAVPTVAPAPTAVAAVEDTTVAPKAFQIVPGTRPEITPIADHYKVFLQTNPTFIDGESWILPITGLVDNPLELTLEDFVSRWEPREQYVTISCISGRIGTDLISTQRWTGVSVQDVLAEVGLQDNAQYLYIKSGDGFYETVDLDLIASDPRIMFTYAWDGELLPKEHGFPLRIWIPDRFGMKQPKWITEIEVIEEYREGYWVERNWDKDALVRTTSVIDTVAVDDVLEESGQQLIPVGGIAFSGDRQISKVEVSVDGGPWQEARLKNPLSETTWVIWRYEWPFQEGKHTFEVRCYEGDGTLQIIERMGNRPSGATGIHSVDARV